MGLVAFASAMLVEAVGAFGYGPGGGERTGGLAGAHDLGVVLTGVGVAAAVVGAGVGIGAALDARPGVPRWAAVAVAVVFIVPGLLFTRLLAGGL